MKPDQSHIAGLELALQQWNNGGPAAHFAAQLRGLIDQAKAAPAEAEDCSQADSIAHLTKCADDTCERCENLMHFYQSCDYCGAWGHNDAGPCLCTGQDARQVKP